MSVEFACFNSDKSANALKEHLKALYQKQRKTQLLQPCSKSKSCLQHYKRLKKANKISSFVQVTVECEDTQLKYVQTINNDQPKISAYWKSRIRFLGQHRRKRSPSTGLNEEKIPYFLSI